MICYSQQKLVIACLILALGAFVSASQAQSTEALSPIDRWDTEFATITTRDGEMKLSVPVNYKVGRGTSQAVPVKADELITFATDIQTHVAGNQDRFYRCWLEIEFLRGNRVIQTGRSREIIGSRPTPQFLALTAAAPANAEAARFSVCAQNKFWAALDNQVTVTNLQFRRLDGHSRGEIQLTSATELPKHSGERRMSIVVRADWPDGTAVGVTTSRGTTPLAVLLKNGQASIQLTYEATDVGAAEVSARILERSDTLQVSDPVAASLQIQRIEADGIETPARIQLIRDGVMVPGRYQAAIPGIFVSAPWSIDLAPGTWQVRISRGPEFQVLERTLVVKSGDAVKMEQVELKRNVNPPESGWYGGDADGDVYHGEEIYTDVSAETAAEISHAMGLNWVGAGSWRSPSPKTWGEARAEMQKLSHPSFLFLWTDEKPKSRQGHVCFLGLDRPDSDPFPWGWTAAKHQLRNFELLQIIRASGAATFANHPLRWWTTGERFTTNMYASLPFDLCAAGLLDGYNVNEKPDDLAVWSMLLDHGYRVTATAGTDFGLDRPLGPVPGQVRMYCHCPGGLSSASLADAVRQGRTVVSTGPVLLANLEGRLPGSTVKAGQTYTISAKAWSRGDEPDTLKRIELWSHGKAIAAKELDAISTQADVALSWKPEGDWDWVSVRALSRRGWAMTSAFYAASPDWQAPAPVECRLTLNLSGLSEEDRARAQIEVWDQVPSLVTARRLVNRRFPEDAVVDVAVTSMVVVRTADGRKKEISVYDAIGMAEHVERIASGVERERPLLNWKTYEEILNVCREAQYEVIFER